MFLGDIVMAASVKTVEYEVIMYNQYENSAPLGAIKVNKGASIREATRVFLRTLDSATWTEIADENDFEIKVKDQAREVHILDMIITTWVTFR